MCLRKAELQKRLVTNFLEDFLLISDHEKSIELEEGYFYQSDMEVNGSDS